MQDNQQSWNLHSHAISWSLSIVSAVLVMFFVTVPLNQSARAQTFQVLYSFSGTPDGASPSNLIIDAAGNLYGVASGGGINYNGTVFKLSRENSGWVLARLYSFQGGADGCGYTRRAARNTKRPVTTSSKRSSMSTSGRRGSRMIKTGRCFAPRAARPARRTA